MKKIMFISISMLILIMANIFISCSKDHEQEGTPEETTNKNAEQTADKITEQIVNKNTEQTIDLLANYRWIEGKYTGSVTFSSSGAGGNTQYTTNYFAAKVVLNADTTINFYIRGGINESLEHAKLSINIDTTEINVVTDYYHGSFSYTFRNKGLHPSFSCYGGFGGGICMSAEKDDHALVID